MEILRNKGYSLREISKVVKRSISTLSDELKRNPVKGNYTAKKAQQKSVQRRKNSKFQSMEIVKHSALRTFVEAALLKGYSPASIAGRIKYHHPELPTVSKNTIYRFLESPYGREFEGLRILHRPKKSKKRPKVSSLPDRVFIDQRPENINDRSSVGDAEADFIVSGKKGHGRLLVVTDRKIRVGFIEQILTVTIEEVHKAFLRIKKRYPELRTITTDNDLLFQHHKELEKLLNSTIYFCHPYHSWEKGTVENINKHIRKMIPKGSDISLYSQKFISQTEDLLNTRYMECLEFATPQEALLLHRKNLKIAPKKNT